LATSFLPATVTFDLYWELRSTFFSLSCFYEAYIFNRFEGLNKVARADLNIFVRIFHPSGSFQALSTIETMSGRLCNAPKPPPKPYRALRGF
jgi:hypothetical protein